MTYTEEQVRAAWSNTMGRMCTTPNQGTLQSIFLAELKKEKPVVLFSKKELLEAAITDRARMLVHGIFGLLGTELANEDALRSRAEEMGCSVKMEQLLRMVRHKQEESFEPGQVVRDAGGTWARWDGTGFLTFGSSLRWTGDQLKRPLEKM